MEKICLTKPKAISLSIIPPAYVITGPQGYFERVDSWGNARWTQNRNKAFSGLFGDCHNEVAIRGLKEIEIKMK